MTQNVRLDGHHRDADIGESTKMDLTDAGTRKRTLVETRADDDEPAEKYWRAEDFVAKASMYELTGNFLTDEDGIFDKDAAEDTWAEIAQVQAATSTGKRRPRRLRKRWSAYWRMELWKREDATNFKSLTHVGNRVGE